MPNRLRSRPENVERGRALFQNQVDSGALISNEPLREAYERGHVSASHIAREMDWMRPDTNRVRRTLGISRMSNPRLDPNHHQGYIRYDTALALCRVFGLDPVEAGV